MLKLLIELQFFFHFFSFFEIKFRLMWLLTVKPYETIEEALIEADDANLIYMSVNCLDIAICEAI